MYATESAPHHQLKQYLMSARIYVHWKTEKRELTSVTTYKGMTPDVAQCKVR